MRTGLFDKSGALVYNTGMTDQRKVRFSRAHVMQVDATAHVAPGHTITKERAPAQRSGESGFAIFRCTCGWSGRTATGVSNTLAEMHARDAREESA